MVNIKVSPETVFSDILLQWGKRTEGCALKQFTPQRFRPPKIFSENNKKIVITMENYITTDYAHPVKDISERNVYSCSQM